MIYNRKSKTYYEESQYGLIYLKFLYHTCIGRIILKLLINPFISKIAGLYNDSRLSKIKIKRFIKKNNIDMNEYEKEKYNSFNDFFIRKKIINIKKPKNYEFISPADSKLLVYNIDKDLHLKIKNSVYTLSDLVLDENLDEYKNGYCLVFRLGVDDYHRFCHVSSGTLVKHKKMKGCLHTVSSISKEYKIYSLNQREYSILKTKEFGNLISIEVGALLVGKIVNYNNKEFKKFDEKGYFKFGGSTIVYIVNNIKIDDDIILNSKQDIETKVSYGEVIGTRTKI